MTRSEREEDVRGKGFLEFVQETLGARLGPRQKAGRGVRYKEHPEIALEPITTPCNDMLAR